jgi:hypothetical protein
MCQDICALLELATFSRASSKDGSVSIGAATLSSRSVPRSSSRPQRERAKTYTKRKKKLKKREKERKRTRTRRQENLIELDAKRRNPHRRDSNTLTIGTRWHKYA